AWRSAAVSESRAVAMRRGEMSADVAVLDPIQAHEIDNDLERSLTHEWDAQIMTYPNERFPFNEWILGRINKMGYGVTDLSTFHEVVPQADTYRVTKHLFADTNLP